MDVVILQECLREWEAFAIERATIKKFGRKDLGTGPLLNLTDGGEGPSGYIKTVTAETKARMSLSQPNRRKIVAVSCGFVMERFDCIADAMKAGYFYSAIQAVLQRKRSS